MTEELQGLLAGATEPMPKPLPEQDTRVGEAMAGIADDRARKEWRDRVDRAKSAIVDALPDLLASLTAKYAEREIMVAALLDIAKTSRDEGGCFYNNRISISRARDTLKEIGIDWLNPEGALHQNPESKA